MDIRNVEYEPEVYLPTADYLAKIYKLGTIQMKEYQKVEGLPDPPIDVNTRGSQVILKDFIGRIIEELSEGYESTTEVNKIMDKAGYNVQCIPNNIYCNELLNHLQNANEEQADAIGFFITLLNYSNILPEDIYEYVSIHLDRDVSDFDTILSYGVKLILDENPDLVEYVYTHGYPILNKEIARDMSIHKYNLSYDSVNDYTPGFHDISPVTRSNEVTMLWSITHQLNITRNLLKNRPWKQTQVMTKEVDYQESLVKSFIMYFGYLAVMGFNSFSIYRLFHRKQILNLWRIKSSY